MSSTIETKIEEILESIRPALKADGGDVEFLRFVEDRGVVELRLLGACEDCPISMMTLKEGIERRLKSGVPGITEVRAV
jgi:Fe-S cluster biogenesis protein NfuA